MTQTDRDALLEAALIHVPFEGMNEAALAAGARDIGMSRDLVRVHFPQGGAGLAAAYHRRADEAVAGPRARLLHGIGRVDLHAGRRAFLLGHRGARWAAKGVVSGRLAWRSP